MTVWSIKLKTYEGKNRQYHIEISEIYMDKIEITNLEAEDI
jgi:hypothetical protein